MGDINVAYLVIKQLNKVVIERDISTAVIGESSISWKLTQSETFLLKKSNADIFCDWKLNDGTRGRSVAKTESVEDTGKNEVI